MKRVAVFFKKIYSHALFRGSFVMFASAMAVNAGNYLYHLVMGRMLGPVNYGVLASIISSLYLLGIIPLSLGIVITKYISDAFGKNDISKLNAFYYWMQSKLFILGFFVTILLLCILPFWGSFLKITDFQLLITAVIVFPASLFLLLVRSYFIGTLNFGNYSLSTFAEAFLKLMISIIFVFFGWSVFGALFGIVMGMILGYIFCLPFVKIEKNKTDTKFSQQNELYSYSTFVLLSTIGFTSLYSTDIILVKHYFSSFDAGIYASLSVLGKIVFFTSSSFAGVMFPLVSQRHARKENYKKIFWLAFVCVGILSITISFLYLLAPKLMINLLFGSKYLQGKELLFPIAVFISFYSLANLMVNFFLSIGKKKAALFPFTASVLQIILILLFHNSLALVVLISIITTFILLLSLLIYYPYATKS